LFPPVSGRGGDLVIEYSLEMMQVHTIELVESEALKSAAEIKFVSANGFGARSVSTGPKLFADRV
jgi:hypothetical protein